MSEWIFPVKEEKEIPEKKGKIFKKPLCLEKKIEDVC
jgi:hypothetical protein